MTAEACELPAWMAIWCVVVLGGLSVAVVLMVWSLAEDMRRRR